jgi:hypothetical protein
MSCADQGLGNACAASEDVPPEMSRTKKIRPSKKRADFRTLKLISGREADKLLNLFDWREQREPVCFETAMM